MIYSQWKWPAGQCRSRFSVSSHTLSCGVYYVDMCKCKNGQTYLNNVYILAGPSDPRYDWCMYLMWTNTCRFGDSCIFNGDMQALEMAT